MGHGGALLVEEFWLLTTGAHLLPGPTTPVRLGAAMAVVRELERLGEVAWTGRGPTAALDVRSECGREGQLGAWHAALADYAGPAGVLPARFCLDPLIEDVWATTAARLHEQGRALRHANRFTADLYGVTDVAAVRAWRESAAVALPGAPEVPQRAYDVLLVAHAAHALPELFGGPGYDVPAALQSAIGAVIRREGGAAHYYREAVTRRDAGGWAYGPAAR